MEHKQEACMMEIMVYIFPTLRQNDKALCDGGLVCGVDLRDAKQINVHVFIYWLIFEEKTQKYDKRK